ncbi:MAG: hypothetical protein Fur0046_31380 [Cyanobacteria bacterium J069]|nr:MAG: hypothetical protein D6742_11460 [Cyanobacteria bacterium J069]
MATITWFEGNDGTQDVIRRDSFIGSKPYSIASDLKKVRGQNDEIRSAVLEYIPVNTRITVYDSPDGKTNDDWATLVVKDYKRRIVIRHFEESQETTDYSLQYHRKNGLNGKISRIVIDAPPQQKRELLAYVRDQILEEVGPFLLKGGQASEFESSNHHYRIWTPSITPIAGGGLFANAKMDHIRGGVPDDHAGFGITFNKQGLPTKIDYRLEINNSDPLASMVELRGDMAEAASKMLGELPAPEAQVAAALSQMSGMIFQEMGKLIRELRETGGRVIFPDVIQLKINEVGYAVYQAYRQHYDEQLSLM